MILTISLTLLLEGAIAAGYARWCGKPLRPILLTVILANLLTQSLLWIGLALFFHHSLSTLYFAEILIWMLESILLHRIPANKLGLWEAILLSLATNLASFGLGLFLPI